MGDTLLGPPEPPPWNELRGLGDMARLPWRWPGLVESAPPGDGSLVWVLPGFRTDDRITFMLRRFLQRVGYRVRGWGLGRNGGDVERLLPRLVAAAGDLSASHGPLAIVGWSLGGYLGREVARERPELVRRVVTLGSPVVGGPKYTVAARHFRRAGIDLDAIERQVADRARERPLRVPVTALYGRGDAIVAWRACIDRLDRTTEHVEVGTTHLGLGFSPEVYRVVAERLARRGIGTRGTAMSRGVPGG